MKVLLLACDPEELAEPLRLDDEARGVIQSIRDSRDRALRLEMEWAVTVDDLQRVLLYHRPQIVHFAGHGDYEQGIYLREDGCARAVSAEALCDLFRIVQSFVRVVVLNACETAPTAEALSRVVDCAIGMNAVVTDPAAAMFAASFYGALASGMPLRDAFDLGVNRLRLDDSEEWSLPRIFMREGVNARDLTPQSPASPVEKAFRDGEISPVLRDAVLFAATYLAPLSAADFSKIVFTLLEHGEDPVFHSCLAQWRENADGVLAACGLGVTGAGSMIAFSDADEGERVRDRLSRHAPLRVHAFVRTLERANLLFDPSDAVASAVAHVFARLAVDVRSHGVEWLCVLFSHARNSAKIPPALLIDRFAALLARYFTTPELAAEADAVLAELMLAEQFDDALALVRRLLHQPGFASYDWLRRLADSGHAPLHAAVREILRAEFNGDGFCSLLAALESWLPARDALASPCRASGELVFQTTLEYAIASAATLQAVSYGTNAKSDQAAAVALTEGLPGRLVAVGRLLFHPALPQAIGSTPTDRARDARWLLAGWVAEWVFALGSQAIRDTVGESTAGASVEALLAEVERSTSGAASRATRLALIACWEEMRRHISASLVALGRGHGAERRNLERKRETLAELVSRFRSAVNRSGKSRGAAGNAT